jgi:hypothetical protein
VFSLIAKGRIGCELERLIASSIRPSGDDKLYDAVYFAADTEYGHTGSDDSLRERWIIAVTDSADSGSRHSESELSTLLRRTRTKLFVVGTILGSTFMPFFSFL